MKRDENTIGHSFEVWQTGPIGPFLESPQGTRCVASFLYFQEALDYLTYATARGAEVFIRSSSVSGIWSARPSMMRKPHQLLA